MVFRWQYVIIFFKRLLILPLFYYSKQKLVMSRIIYKYKLMNYVITSSDNLITT